MNSEVTYDQETGEPLLNGYPLYSGLPQRDDGIGRDRDMIECGTCGYPLLPEERRSLTESNGKMVKSWVGLSYRDVMGIFEHWDFNRNSSLVEFNRLELCELFELVETKLKEKNT